MTVSPTPITRTESARARLRELMAHRESGVFLALVIFFVSMFTVSPIFRSPFNLTTILRQISVTSRGDGPDAGDRIGIFRSVAGVVCRPGRHG